jgi:hypothetical protein
VVAVADMTLEEDLLVEPEVLVVEALEDKLHNKMQTL